MSKLARQIILTITVGVCLFIINIFLPLCRIGSAGYYTCIVLESLLAAGLVVCTVFIWTKKNVPDFTIGKRD